jgi:hypothetical protein
VHSHLSAAESSHHRNITREELLRPLSVFPFVEDVGFSKARPGSGGKRRSAKASETGEVERVLRSAAGAVLIAVQHVWQVQVAVAANH